MAPRPKVTAEISETMTLAPPRSRIGGLLQPSRQRFTLEPYPLLQVAKSLSVRQHTGIVHELVEETRELIQCVCALLEEAPSSSRVRRALPLPIQTLSLGEEHEAGAGGFEGEVLVQDAGDVRRCADLSGRGSSA
ncbi:MAG TPA: hypothetical protein DEF51_09560 [Myxococcales bacterium]|nr:hypothetical protein [Myxococcales bacterium]